LRLPVDRSSFGARGGTFAIFLDSEENEFVLSSSR